MVLSATARDPSHTFLSEPEPPFLSELTQFERVFSYGLPSSFFLKCSVISWELSGPYSTVPY